MDSRISSLDFPYTIFFICNVNLNTNDAQTVHIRELIYNFSKENRTFLFAPLSKNNNLNIENFIQIPSIKPFFFLSSLFYQIYLILYLFVYVRKYSPHVLYCRYSNLMFSPLIISKLFHVPIIFEINGLLSEETKVSSNVRSHSLILKFLRSNEGFLCKNANHIVAVTPGIKKAIMEDYQISHITVIKNGANTDFFKPMDTFDAKLKVGLDINAKYISFIGNLAAWQGVEYFIKAMQDVIKLFPESKAIIVGDGKEQKKLVDLTISLNLNEVCIFIGAVPYEIVPYYINASEICVIPKIPMKSGYSPLKLYEYLACGKAVVATRTEGFEDIIDNKMGVTFEPLNSSELAKSIQYLLGNENIRKEMGLKGRNYVVNGHSWESVVKKIVKLCKSLANETKEVEE